ncbi:MAG: hypothetical protein V4599_08155, partial [Verrucomicrobiota bacterium]
MMKPFALTLLAVSLISTSYGQAPTESYHAVLNRSTAGRILDDRGLPTVVGGRVEGGVYLLHVVPAPAQAVDLVVREHRCDLTIHPAAFVDPVDNVVLVSLTSIARDVRGASRHKMSDP